jgi:hypothetical protein
MVSRLRSVDARKVADQAVKYFDRRLIIQQNVTTVYGFGRLQSGAHEADKFSDLFEARDCSTLIAAKARGLD